MLQKIKAEKKQKVTYFGELNRTVCPSFAAIARMTQAELKKKLPSALKKLGYGEVISGNGWVYARGDVPVLLTAHLDTVHESAVIDTYEYVDKKGRHVITSPQGIGGDDRCGVWIILQAVREIKPYVLFCENEEVGGIGSDSFCRTNHIKELEQMHFLVELDRKGNNDAVFYDCDNPEFTDFVEKTIGYKENSGSFSDISNLAPACNVAAVNLSCGYHKPHTTQEYVVIEEMRDTVKAVQTLLNAKSERFEYIERARYGSYYGYGNMYGGVEMCMEVIYTKGNKTCSGMATGVTEAECWGNFFMSFPNVRMNDVLDYYLV